MKKFNKKSKFLKKIKNRVGETLVEVMVSMLIGVFSCILLAQVIATSTSLDSSSRATFKSYNEKNNILSSAFAGETVTGIKSKVGNVIISGVDFKDANNNIIYKDNIEQDIVYRTEYFINDNISGEEVIAYRIVD